MKTSEDILKSAIVGAKKGCDMFENIANILGISYLKKHESQTDEIGWPGSFNTIEKALEKITRPQAMWYHYPSMNLVIYDEVVGKVGIKSTSFKMLGVGFINGRLLKLIDGLQQKILETTISDKTSKLEDR